MGRADRAGAATRILLLICWFWVDLRFGYCNPLASGRELRSDGGNATRQNLGLGWTNCTPTSATPACPGLLSARAGDFFTGQNVTERQVLARADRFSQQDECAVGAHHSGLGPFGKCGAIGLLAMHDDSHTKKDALAPPLAWGISGPRARPVHNPPSFYADTSAMTASKTGVNCAKKVVRKRYEPFQNGILFMDRLRPPREGWPPTCGVGITT